MRLLCCLTLFWIGTGWSIYADQPDWPIAPVPKVVVPDEMPGPISVLSGTDTFVVQSDEDVQLLASPQGVVTIDTQPGPVRLRNKFADGKGVEVRVYSKKQVFIVERVLDKDGVPVPGTVELLLVPRGKVERRLVTDGSGPRPPPKPDDPPAPKPPEPVSSFRVIFVYETQEGLTGKPLDKAVIFGPEVEAWLSANCTGGKAGFRRRDKDAPGENDTAFRVIWNQAQAEFLPPKSTRLPAAVIAVNTTIYIEPTNVPVKDFLATLKKYRGVQ